MATIKLKNSPRIKVEYNNTIREFTINKHYPDALKTLLLLLIRLNRQHYGMEQTQKNIASILLEFEHDFVGDIK